MYHNEIDDDGSRLLVSIVNLVLAEMMVMLVVLEPRVCVFIWYVRLWTAGSQDDYGESQPGDGEHRL